ALHRLEIAPFVRMRQYLRTDTLDAPETILIGHLIPMVANANRRDESWAAGRKIGLVGIWSLIGTRGLSRREPFLPCGRIVSVFALEHFVRPHLETQPGVHRVEPRSSRRNHLRNIRIRFV